LMGEAGAVLISPAGRIVTCTGTRMDGILPSNELMVMRLA